MISKSFAFNYFNKPNSIKMWLLFGEYWTFGILLLIQVNSSVTTQNLKNSERADVLGNLSELESKPLLNLSSTGEASRPSILPIIQENKPSLSPLELLFPQLLQSASTTNKKEQLKLNLSSAILNHTLFHQRGAQGEESDGSDEELDRLVFKSIPQGSKLVLQAMKLVKTGDDGIEEMIGDPQISLDILPLTEDDYDVSEEDEEQLGSDLNPDASSHPKKIRLNSDTAASSSQSSGSHIGNRKGKSNHHKHHYGENHGRGHKKMVSGSHGNRSSKYNGDEDDVNEFKHSSEKSHSNDGERYKKLQKKNKGRKVTGFKRVYHKEEFQRTEHFYNDEEARKVAESFGLTENKGKNEHSVKDDKRQYHKQNLENSKEGKGKDEHLEHKDSGKGASNEDIENPGKKQHPAFQGNHQPQLLYQQQQRHSKTEVPLRNPTPYHHYNSAKYYPPSFHPNNPKSPTLSSNPSYELRLQHPKEHQPGGMRYYYATKNHQLRQLLPTTLVSNYFAPNFSPTTTFTTSSPYFIPSHGPPNIRGTLITPPRSTSTLAFPYNYKPNEMRGSSRTLFPGAVPSSPSKITFPKLSLKSPVQAPNLISIESSIGNQYLSSPSENLQEAIFATSPRSIFMPPPYYNAKYNDWIPIVVNTNLTNLNHAELALSSNKNAKESLASVTPVPVLNGTTKESSVANLPVEHGLRSENASLPQILQTVLSSISALEDGSTKEGKDSSIKDNGGSLTQQPSVIQHFPVFSTTGTHLGYNGNDHRLGYPIAAGLSPHQESRQVYKGLFRIAHPSSISELGQHGVSSSPSTPISSFMNSIKHSVTNLYKKVG